MIRKKKEIEEEIEFKLYDEEKDYKYSNDDFLEEVDLDILIERLCKMRNTFPNHKIQINIHAGYESLNVYFYGKRLETDEEFADRKERSRKASIAAKKREAEKKKKKIEEEKAEYERLKKIYGD